MSIGDNVLSVFSIDNHCKKLSGGAGQLWSVLWTACRANNGADDGRLMGTVEEVTHPTNIKMKGALQNDGTYLR